MQNWDDLRLFFHIAESGGLSAAARETGSSPATLGRRMLALEEALGLQLFVRSRNGYELTPEGQGLLVRVKPMAAAARSLDQWLDAAGNRPAVRISAGTATAAFMADHFTDLWRPEDPFRITFCTTEARLDIAHREVEIGIRNSPPTSGNLASKPLQTLRFAPFRARHMAEPEAAGWVAVDEAHAMHPAARWVLRQPVQVTAWASSVATMHDLVRGCAGIGVMPCFVGDADPRLTRAGPLIDELTERQHLVSHNDDRHRPEIREVYRRISTLFARHAPLLAGERPIGLAGAGPEA
ncbi:LysR family transcriptional regulator [Vannielia litorea]|uniref:LysR family transcriptional regulator n=1 Tax=Vannielia litorea TaxID=1217970 RepID=UPI001C981EB4|nr:LysR family transcriptional regulator [Vannielia litorea]MBY6152268.1 LysR family transcriptional regulator [Vannielia litorea]